MRRHVLHQPPRRRLTIEHGAHYVAGMAATDRPTAPPASAPEDVTVAFLAAALAQLARDVAHLATVDPDAPRIEPIVVADHPPLPVGGRAADLAASFGLDEREMRLLVAALAPG